MRTRAFKVWARRVGAWLCAVAMSAGSLACSATEEDGPRERPSPQPPSPARTWEARVAELRAARRADGFAIGAAEARALPADVHLVLDAGSCHRAEVLGTGSLEGRLEDERGRLVGRGRGAEAMSLPELCPRWTGSFTLRVEGTGEARVLLASRPATGAPPP